MFSWRHEDMLFSATGFAEDALLAAVFVGRKILNRQVRLPAGWTNHFAHWLLNQCNGRIDPSLAFRVFLGCHSGSLMMKCPARSANALAASCASALWRFSA